MENRIIGLPANPDTARGYSGDVLLDEFALHRDAKSIWAAMIGRVTRGYDLRVMSSMKGTDNKFYELAKELGLHEGTRPARQPVKAKGWSGHWIDIWMAREQGLAVDIEGIREAIADEEIFLQEYCNVPISGAESFIPLELVLANESTEASLTWDGQARPGLSAGFDVARKRDLSVIVIGEPAADLAVVKGVIWMERMKFSEQKKIAREVAAAVEVSGGKFAVDATGIGAQIAEELSEEFPCVEPVQFAARVDTGQKTEDDKPLTVPVKERMATLLKRRFEDHLLRLPESPRLRRACQAVKRYVGPTGAIRFDAARTDAGHADEFWALALMVSAMTGARNYVAASEGGLLGRPMMGGLLEKVF
jgi:phage FluMu gp28-like protein